MSLNDALEQIENVRCAVLRCTVLSCNMQCNAALC